MSREQILGAIRRGLRRGELAPDGQAMLRARLRQHPRHLIPARSQVSRPEQVALFVTMAEREFATVARLPGMAEVPGAVADYLAANNLPADLVMAPHSGLRALPWADRPLLTVREGRALPDDVVSLSHAFAAVAETGTLMLPSAPDRPTTLNLLADTAMVVLRATDIVGPYEDAWDRLRHAPSSAPGSMPRNVMLVTGPSRSADIEQTLELGAHGPRQLHILLVEDDPAALAA